MDTGPPIDITPAGGMHFLDLGDGEERLDINYVAEPTLAAFHNDDSLVRGIMGPIGSGKSSACVVEVFNRALRQRPYKGVRRSRVAIVRNTFPMLRSTTIETWGDWVPDDICRIVYHSPIEGNIKEQPIVIQVENEQGQLQEAYCEGSPHGYDMGNGEILDLEVWFFALDRPGDIRRLLSLELTFAWINEARELPLEVVEAVFSRTGRYPRKAEGGMNWRGLWMDTNPMPTTHWWYRKFELEKPQGWRHFHQPPAMLLKETGKKRYFIANKAAEGVKHQPLGYRYWSEQIPGKRFEWVKINVMGNYGVDQEGRPVYENTWNDDKHVSGKPLDAWNGIPLRIGWDFGLTPACIVGQLLPTGRIQILREYICKRGGTGDFCREVVLPALANEFPNHKGNWIVTGDPSGAPHKDLPNVLTPMVELERQGMKCAAAPTNDPVVRIASVDYFLLHFPDGEPAFLLDPSCVVLREGFQGMYYFARLQTSSAEPEYRDVPKKNDFSHPHDALQYLAMDARGVRPQDVAEFKKRAKINQKAVWPV